MEENKINPLEVEQRAIDVLIDKGVKFDVPRQGIFRLFYRNKNREFTIHEPYTGTMDLLADCFIKLELDEDALKENPTSEANHIIKKSTRLTARIVAIAVLNRRCYTMTNLSTGAKGFYNHSLIESYANYFFWHLKPSKLAQLAIIIKYINNAGDFISSIRSMSGIIRTTQPKADLVEVKQQA